MYAAADAARSLSVADEVRCGPDLPVPYFLQPFSEPRRQSQVTMPLHFRPKALLFSLLRQEALTMVDILTSLIARHYYTDSSVG